MAFWMGANQRSNIFLTISNPLPPPLPQEFTNLYCTSKGTCRVWSLGGGYLQKCRQTGPEVETGARPEVAFQGTKQLRCKQGASFVFSGSHPPPNNVPPDVLSYYFTLSGRWAPNREAICIGWTLPRTLSIAVLPDTKQPLSPAVNLV